MTRRSSGLTLILWRDIPAQINGGERDAKHQIVLSARFQKAIDEAARKGEVLTGVFYVDTSKPNFMELLEIEDAPLATLPELKVRPPREVLDQVMEELR